MANLRMLSFVGAILLAAVSVASCGGGGVEPCAGCPDTTTCGDPGGYTDASADPAPSDDGAPADVAPDAWDKGEVIAGQFGAACDDNADCDSGFCVEGPNGFVCTEICLEDCPGGYSCKGLSLGGDVIFLCMPEFVRGCQVCAKDSQCGGGRCVDVDGSGRCAAPCEDDGSCMTAGFACVDKTVPSTGNDEKLCLPTTGSCECMAAEQAGNVRPCSNDSDHGTCYGVETCDPATGWIDCSADTPEAEKCNGLDENCNGKIDEGLPETEPCEASVDGVGTCPGDAVCMGVLGWVCGAPTPQVETCDYVDNDCDGVTDDGFAIGGVYGGLEDCGACGVSCVNTIPNAVEACDASGPEEPHCVVDECDPGFIKVNESQCFSLTTTICVPCDDDVDCASGTCVPMDGGSYCSAPCSDQQVLSGYTCGEITGLGTFWLPESGACGCGESSAGQKRPCFVTNDTGTCYGFETCDPLTGWVGCTAATPAPEACNGLDDDCDAIVDEGFNTGEACSVEIDGVGTCTGVWVCQGPLGEVCSAAEPKVEECNYVDDDCDGEVDDGFAVGGVYLGDQDCGVCGNDCLQAITNGTGKCEEGPDGPRCIIASCDQGFYPVGDIVCLGVPDVVCSPCTEDAQCLGGSCVQIGAGMFCTRQCDVDHPCSDGYACTDVGGQDSCMPDTGDCGCSAANTGALRLCQTSNVLGTCFGTEVCDPGDGGWTQCNAPAPTAETCNGTDDDCDGQVDEGIPATQECANTVEGVGSCQGIATCAGADGYVCNAPTPEPETCDYADNDCDGDVDEDFSTPDPASGLPVYDNVENCGACGKDCNDLILNGTAACDASGDFPKCVVAECDPGYYQLGDYQCIPAPPMTCQPCDTDEQCLGSYCALLDGKSYCLQPCDQGGSACEPGFACQEIQGGKSACVPTAGSCDCGPANDGAKRACSQANAFGTCFGFQTCDAATGWNACDAPLPAQEACDGLDNDCNGSIDDGLPEAQPCETSNEFGTCQGEAFCYGKAGWVCQAGEASAEVCDYQDNDCNGVVDDPFTSGGVYVDQANCGSCGNDCGTGYPHATTSCVEEGGFAQCVVTDCDQGYFKLNDFQCIPDVAKLCDPCFVDDNCIVEGARCVDVGGEGTFCGLPCEVQQDCDDKVAGYACTDFGGFRQCVPATGSCTCDGSTTGFDKACSEVYEPQDAPAYTCFGNMTCTDAGWTGCVMPDEECNLADDDCDGQTDEGFLDQDGKYTSDENCGKCGNNCTLLVFGNAFGECKGDVVPIRCGPVCKEGYFDLDFNPNDCECHYLSGTDFPGVDMPSNPDDLDVNCDGVDGEVDNAVFVGKNGDDANPGTIDLPKRTVQAGIDTAAAQGLRDVYVSTGVYVEAVTLSATVGVYGGYSADYRVHDPALYESAIMGPEPTDVLPGVVNAFDLAGGLPGTAVFDGFTVFAYSEKRPGRSSYGIYLSDCDSTLRVSSNRVMGGAGGPGSRGVDGDDGADGKQGKPGVNAFDLWEIFQPTYTVKHCEDLDTLGLPRPLSDGGAGGVFACGTVDTSGGNGGNRVCPEYDDDLDAAAPPVQSEFGTAGANSGGDGGAPGRDVYHQAYSCDGYSSFGPVEGDDGADGTDGSSGQPGSGCANTDGLIISGMWLPDSATDGTTGLPGSGGGGGGSGGGAWVHTSCFAKGFGYDNFGASGGGAGSGGCQGTGATAGTGGGGAFAIFVVFSTPPASLPDMSGNSLSRGFGGPGGDGGNGGVGGSGGPGALGGAAGGGYDPPTTTYPSFKGGKGGQGGQGGHGGGGGGGCGGPAYGIFVSGDGGADLSGWKADNPVDDSGSGGSGGLGGFSLGAPGGDGLDGASSQYNF